MVDNEIQSCILHTVMYQNKAASIEDRDRNEALRWVRGRLAWEKLLDELRGEPPALTAQTKRPLAAITQTPATNTAA